MVALARVRVGFGSGLLVAMGLVGCGDEKSSVTFDANSGAGGAQADERPCADGCAPSDSCHEDECLPIRCVPGQSFCAEGEVRRCNEDGTSSEVSQTCGDDRFCVEQAGQAECRAQACTPGESFCQNQLRSACRADGSGPEPRAEDCAASSQVCLNGECVVALCEPLTRTCQGNEVYLCDATGGALKSLGACDKGETCDAELADCRPAVCEPGARSCDGSQVMLCNGSGTGWGAPQETCSQDERCVDGACHAEVCAPKTAYCQDGDVYTCDEHGIAAILSEDCSETEHCHENVFTPGEFYCVDNRCQPGERSCGLVNDVQQCNDDATTYSKVKTCGAEEACKDGACIPSICVGELDCIDGNVVRCSSRLSYWANKTCEGATHCERTGDGKADCVPNLCVPGTQVCLGNQRGECAPDGSGLANVTKDCAGSGEVCVSNSACASIAIDTLGGPDKILEGKDGTFVGNLVSVSSNRNLREIEVNLDLSGTRSLRWVVLESVDSGYSALFDRVTPNVDGSGYRRSGEIEQELLSGKSYLIGVVVIGGAFKVDIDPSPWQRNISFGQVLLGEAGSYSDLLTTHHAPDAEGIFPLRLTTQLN
jgi:hypothetical protein